MPGLAEEPLYGVDATAENGVPASNSIWYEIITEAGDVAVAVTQGLFGQTVTPAATEITYNGAQPEETAATPPSTSWIWWVIGGLALVAIIFLIVYKKPKS